MQRAAQCGAEQDAEALECFAQKADMVRFLVELYECKRKCRSRIAHVVLQLFTFDGWVAAAEEQTEPCVRVAARSIAAAARGEAPLAAFGSPSKAGAAAMDEKEDRRGVDALRVQVLSARGLALGGGGGLADCEGPRVRVSVGGRAELTSAASGGSSGGGDPSSPRWHTAPLVFDAPALDAVVQLEVLQGGPCGTSSLGSIALPLANVPRQPDQPPAHFSLAGPAGVPCGEL